MLAVEGENTFNRRIFAANPLESVPELNRKLLRVVHRPLAIGVAQRALDL